MCNKRQRELTYAERFGASFVSIEANHNFSEAIAGMRDGSKLHFCHRVEERWVKALPGQANTTPGCAGELLAVLAMFRLNAKHLDLRFADSSQWELPFKN
jgi:hypothetical protein